MVYVAHDVEPARLAEAFAGARALDYRGLSITMPHKVAALALVDDVDDMARAIGCINTVVSEDGRLRGATSTGWALSVRYARRELIPRAVGC